MCNLPFKIKSHMFKVFTFGPENWKEFAWLSKEQPRVLI